MDKRMRIPEFQSRANADVQIKQIDLQIKQAENTNVLIKEAIPAIERWATKSAEKEKHVFTLTNGIYVVLFAIIIVGTIYLTSIKVVSSESFAFIMGTIIGAVLTYARDMLPQQQ